MADSIYPSPTQMQLPSHDSLFRIADSIFAYATSYLNFCGSPICCLVDWSEPHRATHRIVFCQVRISSPFYPPTIWLTDRLIGWLIDWLIGWLIDWLTWFAATATHMPFQKSEYNAVKVSYLVDQFITAIIVLMSVLIALLLSSPSMFLSVKRNSYSVILLYMYPAFLLSPLLFRPFPACAECNWIPCRKATKPRSPRRSQSLITHTQGQAGPHIAHQQSVHRLRANAHQIVKERGTDLLHGGQQRRKRLQYWTECKEFAASLPIQAHTSIRLILSWIVAFFQRMLVWARLLNAEHV